MYTIHNYGGMVKDRVRTGSYMRALGQVINSNSVVLDIGTGIGIFALLACKLGARKVYAVESNDVIEVAREIAAANGYEDKIQFIQTLSTEITLPETADVIVSDIHGVLPLLQQHIPSIADARKRLLKPGGAVIPLRETIWVAPVEEDELYSRYALPWCHNDY